MGSSVFTTDDLREIVHRVGLNRLMDEVINGLTTTLRTLDADRIEVPVREGFAYTEPELGLIEWMPVLETDRGISNSNACPPIRRIPTECSTDRARSKPRARSASRIRRRNASEV